MIFNALSFQKLRGSLGTKVINNWQKWSQKLSVPYKQILSVCCFPQSERNLSLSVSASQQPDMLRRLAQSWTLLFRRAAPPELIRYASGSGGGTNAHWNCSDYRHNSRYTDFTLPRTIERGGSKGQQSGLRRHTFTGCLESRPPNMSARDNISCSSLEKVCIARIIFGIFLATNGPTC